MLQLYSNASSACGLKRIRKTAGSFKHAQYQIVCVEGLLDEQEYQVGFVFNILTGKHSFRSILCLILAKEMCWVEDKE